jgi:hypothetical protein
MNQIPNFDAMTEAELMAFWSKYHRPTRNDAATLVGDRRKGFTVIATTLANYACNKACAISLRLKGEVERAQTYEHACDLSYSQLPEDLRW